MPGSQNGCVLSFSFCSEHIFLYFILARNTVLADFGSCTVYRGDGRSFAAFKTSIRPNDINHPKTNLRIVAL